MRLPVRLQWSMQSTLVCGVMCGVRRNSLQTGCDHLTLEQHSALDLDTSQALPNRLMALLKQPVGVCEMLIAICIFA